MALWNKSSPASFCLSRYAPPLRHPVRYAGNGNDRLFSAGFIIPGDVRAATSVELRMSNCAAQPVYPPKWMTPTAHLEFSSAARFPGSSCIKRLKALGSVDH
ncbi:hypothetical protein AMECASPLE_037330 [Ameca splendens]|uniref:Uncharacterized protein n=1 Tax=Ameca splendens TaxID=208324 RepID=A0ABV0Z800_9TELE